MKMLYMALYCRLSTMTYPPGLAMNSQEVCTEPGKQDGGVVNFPADLLYAGTGIS